MSGRPLSPKFEQRLRWMETESRFAHACPDLDQEFPDGYQAQRQGQGSGMLMPWQRWLGLTCSIMALGVIGALLFMTPTMDAIEAMHFWLALAFLFMAGAIGCELHHHHKRLTDIEKDR